MAGRIRTIKPEILSDAKAAKLSHAAWRLWVSSWLLADDEGRLPADPDQLHGQVFWGQPADIHACLAEIQSKGLAMPYLAKGDIYLAITNFRKHQKINRPSGPKFPEPEQYVNGHGGLTEGSVTSGCGISISTATATTTPTVASPTPSESSGPNGSNESKPALVKQTTASVIGAFNRAFNRSLSPAGWESAVAKLISKGFTDAEMRGVVWWAADEWADDPDMRAKVNPKTLLKLQSAQGYRTFREYLSCAGERWREKHGGEIPPWELPEQGEELAQ